MTEKTESEIRKDLSEKWEKWKKENPGKIIPQGMVYACSEPEFIGRLPMKSEVEIISANSDQKIGWTIAECFDGGDVFKEGSLDLITNKKRS